jgi:NADH:ubiquinone reductase (H+-translocating)
VTNHRVVVVGGGFAGVRCCMGLARANVDVTLIDRRNFHLFQPLLYQVATGGLSPGDIAAPLRTVLKHQRNARVVLGEVKDIVDKTVLVDEGEGHIESLAYDTLVVATGATHSYFGKDQWQHIAPGLKTIEDATAIRAKVLESFERAEIEDDVAKREALMTFVIVGGGPTGVELAGALGELSRETMKGEFRTIDPAKARIVLLEGGPRILSMYVDKLAAYAKRTLERLGVDVRTGAKVVGIDAEGVDVETAPPPGSPEGTAPGKQRIAAHTVLWGAGVAGSALGRTLKEKCGAELDRAGRVVVDADCTIKGRSDVFVLGDLAAYAHTEDKKPLPGVAPVAMQMGTYAAKVIAARLAGKPPPGPFKYMDKGTMAVIGRNHAVARVGFGLNWNLRGFLAWMAWLFIHVLYLVDYENRILVLMQWGNNYFTRNRGARLIASPDK